jgi:hypothetical protein
MKLKHIIEIILSIAIYAYFLSNFVKTPIYYFIMEKYVSLIFPIAVISLFLSGGLALLLQELFILVCRKIKKIYKQKMRPKNQ